MSAIVVVALGFGYPPGISSLAAQQQYSQVAVADDTDQPPQPEAPTTVAPADSAYQAMVMADGATSYWRLGETSGTAVSDVVGGSSAPIGGGISLGGIGALLNDPNGAASLDGHNGYLRGATQLAVGPDFTMEAWVKASANPSSGTVASLYADGETRTLYLDGQHFVGMADLSAAWPKSSVIGPPVDPTLWHQVVFTVQAGTSLHLYVDGSDVGSASVARQHDFLASPVLGWSDAAWMTRFSGTLDEVAFYPIALSADRVAAHYMQAGPPCGGSLQTLVDAAPANAVVNVPPCVYRETVIINKPLTLLGQPGAEIRGSDVWTAWTSTGANAWVSGQSVPRLASFANRDRCGEPTHRCLLPQQVFVDGRPLYPLGVGSVPASGQFALDAGRHVVLADNPSGHTVEVSTRVSWVLSQSDGITIAGMTMRHAANDALYGALSNDGYSGWTAQDNVLSDAHGAVISIHDGSNLKVLRNDINRGGDLGVHGDQVTDALVQGNHIEHNNTDHFNAVWSAGGLKVTRVNGLVIDNNEVDSNAGPGLWCDLACDHLTYSANRVHHNLTQGIIFEISTTGTIRDNRIWQNGWSNDQMWGAGLLISSSADVDVYGNAVAWNRAGISVIQQSLPDRLEVRSVRIHDNVVLGADGTLGLLWHADSGAKAAQMFDPSSGNSGARNRFWFGTPEGGQPRFGWNGLENRLDDFEQASGDVDSAYLSGPEKDALIASSGLPGAAE